MNNTPNLGPSTTPHISTNMHQKFEQLERIIQAHASRTSPTSQTQPLMTAASLQIPTQNTIVTNHSSSNVLQSAISSIVKKQASRFMETCKQLCQYLVQHRHVYLNSDYLVQNFSQLRLIVAKHNKLYYLNTNNNNKNNKKQQKDIEYRGYVIVGKAVSVNKRKKKQEDQLDNKPQRDEVIQLVQQGITRIYQDGKYILSKHQKNYKFQDILMMHDMPDASIDEVYLGNQVFSPFVPIQKTIILAIPYKILKPQCFQFIKSSLLHTYIDQANLINKIISKQMFYKNSMLKGFYFVQQGEVQVKSGRIIARGWTTFGICKTSGFGWKFKPIPFIRFLLKNSAIWKQFFSDITANNQYPFNIIHLLSLNDEDDFTSSAQWKSLGRRKIGGKSPKLPRLNIGMKSVDQSKLEQIEKLRHYDDRINNLFSYKQDLLTRKLKGIVHGKFQPIVKDQRSQQKLQKKKKLILLRLGSKGSILAKKQLALQTQPGQNILIMSVLKRLQSIADMNETTTRRRQYSISHGIKDRQETSIILNPIHTKSKRQVKVLPMQIHERNKDLKRSKRY